MENKRLDTRTLTGMALLTAVVVILQLLGSFVRFGPFSISLVLIPIVVGAALYGAWAGGWLGFVFGLVVLFQPDTGVFLTISPLGTILVVLLKGALAGLCAGLVYKALSGLREKKAVSADAEKKPGTDLAVIAAAIVCPVVNTGLFLLGCLVFFLPTIKEWAAASGFENVGTYMLLGLVGGNFLFELLFNIVLSPVIVRLIKVGSHDWSR